MRDYLVLEPLRAVHAETTEMRAGQRGQRRRFDHVLDRLERIEPPLDLTEA